MLTPSLYRTYQLFGITLVSNFPFTYHLQAASGPADLTLDWVADLPASPDGDPVFTSSLLVRGEPMLRAWQQEGCLRLLFPHQADFLLQAERISCHILDENELPVIETNILAAVLAAWLEQRGVLTLHASAVTLNGQGLAFLSQSGNGKTGLCLALVHAGHPMLSDDILPLMEQNSVFYGQPAFPTMRIHPDEAQYFLGAYEHFQRVNPRIEKRLVPVGTGELSSFAPAPAPMRGLFILQRRDPAQLGEEIEIKPFPRAQAAVELVRHSFTARLAAALGWQARRLDAFARLLRQAPVYQLSYPSGFDHLTRVRAVLESWCEDPKTGDPSLKKNGAEPT